MAGRSRSAGADGEDLSAAMVQNGWAFAFVRYSRDYFQLEERARAENVGLHPFHCQLPWEWRAERRQATPSATFPDP